jgi:hypothetical protein
MIVDLGNPTRRLTKNLASGSRHRPGGLARCGAREDGETLTMGCAAEIIAVTGVAPAIAKGKGTRDHRLTAEGLAFTLPAILGQNHSGHIVLQREFSHRSPQRHPHLFPGQRMRDCGHGYGLKRHSGSQKPGGNRRRLSTRPTAQEDDHSQLNLGWRRDTIPSISGKANKPAVATKSIARRGRASLAKDLLFGRGQS